MSWGPRRPAVSWGALERALPAGQGRDPVPAEAHLESCVWCWAPQSKTDKDILEGCEDDEGLGRLSGGKAEAAGTVQPQGELISAHRHLKGRSFHDRCSNITSSYYSYYL